MDKIWPKALASLKGKQLVGRQLSQLEVIGEPEIHPGGPFMSVPGFHGPYVMTFWGKMDMCVPGYVKTQHRGCYPHML